MLNVSPILDGWGKPKGAIATFDDVTELEHKKVALEDLQCIMADIDHFKAVNDTHGHAAGDEVIRRVSELLTTAVRGSDAVCRYGGEEFCIVLPGASQEVAGRVAERLCRTARSPGFAQVPVSVSFGTASIRSGAESIAELLEQSDRALYASKEAGRDRVTAWEDISG